MNNSFCMYAGQNAELNKNTHFTKNDAALTILRPIMRTVLSENCLSHAKNNSLRDTPIGSAIVILNPWGSRLCSRIFSTKATSFKKRPTSNSFMIKSSITLFFLHYSLPNKI